ncbi:hypothetical protein BY996DRAFT_7477435 [Phakopsora pachyrhizi]|uniref:Expressed protein n=1 Tax=Phakopsora pachyrhizi TaxID=170000 RepID=A0AAV0ATY0_PHAPC|nr:hypothetical protein BY996DRAFT_7477435 [Phakopsora pachyrhizi]CAH7672289.1 expressed protein [Phakopsora pachyrhizi]
MQYENYRPHRGDRYPSPASQPLRPRVGGGGGGGDPYPTRPSPKPSSSRHPPLPPPSRYYQTQAVPVMRSNQAYPSRSDHGPSPLRSSGPKNTYQDTSYDRQPVRPSRTRAPPPPPPIPNNRADSPNYDSTSDNETSTVKESDRKDPEGGAWSWNNLKKTVWGEGEEKESTTKDNQAQPQEGEEQNTIWSKLAFVGDKIQKKINGDEGYASDATDYDGESHLTRVMKQYHVEKATSRKDLPDWLFTAEEIRQADSKFNEQPQRRRMNSLDSLTNYDEEQDKRPKGLSDIFDSVNQERNDRSQPSSRRAKQSFDSGYGSSTSSARNNSKGYGARGYEAENNYEGGSESSIKPVGRNRLAGNQPGNNRIMMTDRTQPVPSGVGGRSPRGYEEDYSRGHQLNDRRMPRPMNSSPSLRPPQSESGYDRRPPPRADRPGYEEPRRMMMPIPQNGMPQRRR